MKKHPGGRPSKFKTIDKEQLEMIVRNGFTDIQVCKFFKITEQTLCNYKKKYPEFFESLKDWKKEADSRVERSLYQRAIGYSYDEVVYEKTKAGGLGGLIDADGDIEGIKHVETCKTKVTVKQIAPDVTAQIFWLKNRNPKDWRDKVDLEHSGDINLVFGYRNKKEAPNAGRLDSALRQN